MRSPPRDEPLHSLSNLRAATNECRRCDLWKIATQGVPGIGPTGTSVMLVGEAPGDAEDQQGEPFVGPAGTLLNRALHDARLERDSVYITNAVKHFKFEPRGKRRLHVRPGRVEIQACHWWLAQELRLIAPKVVVALGATAARALLGRVITISRVRGTPIRLDEATQVCVTVHPSALLRMPDEKARHAQYERFVDDLRAARALGRS